MHFIDSRVRLGPDVKGEWPTDIVKNEPMFYRAKFDFAWDHGGPLTQAFLLTLMNDSGHTNWSIDSKVAMLMKGWYPCIPGFHHDDVPRNTEGGQPNYVDATYRSSHAMMLIGDEISRTRFALGQGYFTPPEPGEITYKKWHPVVDSMLKGGTLNEYRVPMNRIVYFNDRSWHEGTPATGSGWRFFIRASTNTEMPIHNEIRKQVQVYLENPMEGW